jgi:hypothetical protein
MVDTRLGQNRELLEATGKVPASQLKVFWLEVDPRHHPTPPAADGWRLLEPHFFFYSQPGVPGSNQIWLDAANERIWYVYSFGKRDDVEAILRRDLLSRRGVDRAWLAERFLESVQRKAGYTDRGFRFSFKGALSRDKDPEGMPRFSGKFWLGNQVSVEQESFLRLSQETFSKSSLRMGRRSEGKSSSNSGLLIEVYSRGHMTVTTCDDTEEILGLINDIGTSYAGDLRELERRRESFPRPVEYRFGMKLDIEQFRAQVEAGVGPTKLWMQEYAEEDGLHRFVGVDLHTNDLLNLDLADSYAYLVGTPKACMNAAPRLMTLSAEFLSGKTDMYYEGAQLFA